MRIYGKYFKKYKALFFIGVTFVFLEAMCDLLQPTIMARIIDQGVRNKNMSLVISLGLLMLLVTALGAAFAATRSILASKVSQSFGADLREDLFAKVMRFSEDSIDRLDSGSLITRLTNDTSQIVQFSNGMMRIFFKAPITFLGSILLAIALSAKLSLVMLTVLVLVTILITISMKLSYDRFAKVQVAVDKVNGVVQEYLMGIRLVKAFGKFQEEETKFEAANDDLKKKNISTQIVITYFAPLLSLSVSLGIAAVLYIGSLIFQQGDIEVGKVAAFISYMAQILISIIMITNVFNTFVRSKASTERINEILESGEDFPREGKGFSEESGTLVFEKVTFAYPHGSGLPAVRDLSFEIKPGETLAIIGPTGSGKSTIMWLCLRFYDVDEGRILVDGTDLKAIDTKKLRDHIAIASQKPELFSGTVLENISWGNSGMSLEDVREAAKVAMADGFIQEMSAGYESLLSQGGVNLSGGQKQRISIARALAKKSPLLILDDSTSALDAVTDYKVRKAIRVFRPGKATIIITQRIGTAMGADKILVMYNGEAAGFGRYEELLETCLTYRELYDSQIGIRMAGENNG